MPDTHTDPDSSPATENSTPVQHSSARRAPAKRTLFGGFALLVLALALIAGLLYWANDKKNTENSTVPVEVVKVNITADGFVPASLQIKPNTQVVWTNKDTVSHEVSLQDANAQPLDISERLAPQESFSTVLDEEKDYYVRSPGDSDKFQGVITVKSKVNSDE